jgi:hypothetical protein
MHHMQAVAKAAILEDRELHKSGDVDREFGESSLVQFVFSDFIL